jgi:hypothetical protein
MEFFKIDQDMVVTYKGKEIERPNLLIMSIRKLFAKIVGHTGHGLSEKN